MSSKSTKRAPTHYVGIGASAGGLEALQEFFTALPCDTGATYVVVQHLSADFKSMMPELLSGCTSMPIFQVADGVLLEANCVYLMPAGKNMLAGEGRLLLSDKKSETDLHLPIDVFFRSLGEDQQHRAIGIILSGTGADGTRGIKAMKEAGGLVIVQEPQSARFDGMPFSAYNTGLVDILLPPEGIASSLVRFIQGSSVSGDSTLLKNSISSNDATLVEIFQMLKKHSDINFSEYKASTVARRIERRLTINQLSSLEEYLGFLVDSPRELQVLSKELLIGVTRFFRDDEAYANVLDQAIPSIIDGVNDRHEPIRVWVAGCSTGEEAYSLAILFDEAIRSRKLEFGVKIFATDVDEDAIAEASNGVYSHDIIQDVTEERLAEYFEGRDESFVVSQRLRQMVIFATHNMIDDPPFSNLDMATCRNVLIYFQHSAQKKVLSSLYFSLKRDGVLFLGGAESLGDMQSHFEVISERSRLFKKVSNVRVPIGNTPPLRDMTQNTGRGMTVVPTASLIKPRVAARPTQVSILERLIEEYAPDCIVLNEKFEATHVYGDVSPYIKALRPGRVSNSIKDMVVDDLSVAVSTALTRSEKKEEDVFYKDVTLSSADGNKTLIDLSILYIKEGSLEASPRDYVVQFVKRTGVGESDTLPGRIAFDSSEQSRQRIHDLEMELVKKQEHLQVTVEELETTNEELQSSNEELMSANEELQSTNEEMQSVNEELYSLNSEYQEKIAELTAVNDDLDSVVTATDIGILFLDTQLTIRKFTPPIARYVHLRNTDLSRPFHHISHELNYDNFLADIAGVSAGGDPVERNVTSHQGHSILVRIMPYVQENPRKLGGVILTMTNVSRQKFVENALTLAQEQLRDSLLNNAEVLHKRVTSNKEVSLLLLDDDAVDRKRTSRMLKNIGKRDFKITECSEIDEAMNFVDDQPFDICLVDYQLAGATAKDFTTKLREANIDTPVVILSGYSEINLDAEFLNTDIFDFLNKDELSGQLLARSIDYVLERKNVSTMIEGFQSS